IHGHDHSDWFAGFGEDDILSATVCEDAHACEQGLVAEQQETVSPASAVDRGGVAGRTFAGRGQYKSDAGGAGGAGAPRAAAWRGGDRLLLRDAGEAEPGTKRLTGRQGQGAGRRDLRDAEEAGSTFVRGGL